MTNWLESEENKISNHLKHEELLHNNLKRFYDLCNRVNNVRPNSLSVYHLVVISQKDVYNELRGKHYGWPSIKRKITFRYVEPDCYYLDLFIRKIYDHSHDGYASDEANIILFTKKIEIEHIVKWYEPSILNFIKWLIVETDSAKEYLPGLMKSSVVYDYNSSSTLRIKILNDDLKVAQSNLNEIESWRFGRSSTEKENQLMSLNKKIDSIKNEIKFFETPSKIYLY